MSSNLIHTYTHNAAYAQQQITKYDKLLNQYSLLRLAVFLLLLVAVYLAANVQSWSLFIGALVVLAMAFNWLLSRQSHFSERKAYFESYKSVNENEITSINSQGNIYADGTAFCNDKHLYTADLDIFGKASLFQLSNRCATALGKIKLASWFTTAADRNTVLRRQAAVKEVANREDWKLELQSGLLFANKQDGQQVQQLFDYLKMPLTIPHERALKMYSQLAPFVMLAAIVLAVFYPPARGAAVVLAFIHNRLVASKKEYVLKADLIAGKVGQSLASYTKAFQLIESTEWTSTYLVALSKDLQASKNYIVSQQIQQLSTLINKLNYRLNLVVNFVLNIFFLWSVRQVIAIEDWKRNNQANLEAAFDILAEYEALISLGGLAINYPEWSFPAIADGEAYTLTAQELAHPLIPFKHRVANDYSLVNTHHIDIITGSNMAGKSTFLRTLGINTVLALAGAPVCGRSMEVAVMQLITYMRIKDSLNESTSTFKAELDRLALLLKTVQQDEKVFFLIDEMLRGTNSVDKYLGSKAVIERLIAQRGVGLVATHDLQLAELEQRYPDYVRNFYFDIQVINGEMLFDYKLKPGECKTFNASLLLKQIGIDVEEG